MHTIAFRRRAELATREEITELIDTIRAALEGDSNDAEHDALAEVASFFGIGYVAYDDLGDEEGGITAEGQVLGHRYVMGNVNAYCPKCSEEQGVTVLDCDYDLDK